ncbi:MAG: hypothetical protein M5R40_29560 [Anaerolineae bacterium]|nr:hypothetical protein [Anaerolineae bacterium]
MFEKLMAWALRNGYVKPGLSERLQAAREAAQKALPEPEPAGEPEQANMFAGKYYEEGL